MNHGWTRVNTDGIRVDDEISLSFLKFWLDRWGRVV